MRYPLDALYITGAFREVAVPGTGLPDSAGVRRHIGVDLRAAVGTPVYAVGDGVVTRSYAGGAGETIEIRIGDKLWRFMHLSKRNVATGQSVAEGQVIGLSGNSGGVAAHLHVDARKAGTLYNASLENYFDPLEVIKSTQGVVMDNQAGVELYQAALHRNPESTGASSQWNGWKPADAIRAIRSSGEWQGISQRLQKYPVIESQVIELTKAVQIKDGEINRLQTELAAAGSDSVNLNALGAALKWLIQRLGLKG